MNEELGADWAQVRVEGGFGNTGSTAISAGVALSRARAVPPVSVLLRSLSPCGCSSAHDAVQAAAQEWNVPAAEIRVDKGILQHGNRYLSFGNVVAKAAALPVPQDIPLKKPESWIYIGRDRDVLRKYDSLANQPDGRISPSMSVCRAFSLQR